MVSLCAEMFIVSRSNQNLQTFTHAMYNLAAYPGYAELMRKELGDVIAKDGWNKASIDRLYLVDSFLRETMRLQSLRDGMSSPQPSATHILTSTLSGRHAQDPQAFHLPEGGR